MKIVMRSLLLLAIIGFSNNAFADLRFGVAAEPYPPFTSKDATGQWVGWEVDFMKTLCAILAEKCTVVEVAWDGILPALQATKFDVILASMSVTEKRRAVIDFSKIYYTSTALMLAAKGQPEYQLSSDISGKVIGVQSASIYQAYAQKHFVPRGAQMKVYSKQDEALSDLAAGRVDYVLGEAIALDAFLQTAQGKCCKSAGPVDYDAEIFGIGVGLGLRKSDAELKERLDKGIAELISDGTLRMITEHWHLTGKIILPSAP